MKGEGVIKAWKQGLRVKIRRLRNHPPLPFVSVDVPTIVRYTHHVLGLDFLEERDPFLLLPRLPLDIFDNLLSFVAGPLVSEVLQHFIGYTSRDQALTSDLWRGLLCCGSPIRRFSCRRHGVSLLLNPSRRNTSIPPRWSEHTELLRTRCECAVLNFRLDRTPGRAACQRLGRSFGSHRVLGKRTADPSTAVGMTKGGAELRFASDAG